MWGGLGGHDLECFGVGGFIAGEGGQDPFLLVGQPPGQVSGPGCSQDVFDLAHGGFFIFSQESLHAALGISQDGCGIIIACFGQHPFFLQASQPAEPLNAKIPEGTTFSNRLASDSLMASQFGRETCFLHTRFFTFCSTGLLQGLLFGQSISIPPLLSQLGLCMPGQGVCEQGGMFCKLCEYSGHDHFDLSLAAYSFLFLNTSIESFGSVRLSCPFFFNNFPNHLQHLSDGFEDSASYRRQ